MGEAAAEITRAAGRAADAEELAATATLFKAVDVTDAQVLSRAALLLRSNMADAMRPKNKARELATSAGASIDHIEAAVGDLTPQFLYQLFSGIHHTEIDGSAPKPPAYSKAVLVAADLFYAATGQYTPKQIAVAGVLRSNRTKNRAIDTLAQLGMCAYARHARELENAVAADPAFSPAAIIARYQAMYDDLMIRVTVDNCDHPVQGAMGLDIQYSHVNIELTLYRRSGLPIAKLGAPKESVRRSFGPTFAHFKPFWLGVGFGHSGARSCVYGSTADTWSPSVAWFVGSHLNMCAPPCP